MSFNSVRDGTCAPHEHAATFTFNLVTRGQPVFSYDIIEVSKGDCDHPGKSAGTRSAHGHGTGTDVARRGMCRVWPRSRRRLDVRMLTHSSRTSLMGSSRCSVTSPASSLHRRSGGRSVCARARVCAGLACMACMHTCTPGDADGLRAVLAALHAHTPSHACHCTHAIARTSSHARHHRSSHVIARHRMSSHIIAHHRTHALLHDACAPKGPHAHCLHAQAHACVCAHACACAHTHMFAHKQGWRS